MSDGSARSPQHRQAGIQTAAARRSQGQAVGAALQQQDIQSFSSADPKPPCCAGKNSSGLSAGADSMDAFAALIRTEHAIWGDIIRQAGMKAE